MTLPCLSASNRAFYSMNEITLIHMMLIETDALTCIYSKSVYGHKYNTPCYHVFINICIVQWDGMFSGFVTACLMTVTFCTS